MKCLILLPLFVASCLAVQASYNQDAAGRYNFNYQTQDAGGHTRSESGAPGGPVSGSYSYIDPNGNLRQVSYTAGPDGFKASGDISVDRKTAADAAAIAALAPKAPPSPAAPVHYAYAFAPAPIVHVTGPFGYSYSY